VGCDAWTCLHSGSERSGYSYKYDIRADIVREHRRNHDNAVANALDQVEGLVQRSTQDVDHLKETIIDTTTDLVDQVGQVALTLTLTLTLTPTPTPTLTLSIGMSWCVTGCLTVRGVAKSQPRWGR